MRTGAARIDESESEDDGDEDDGADECDDEAGEMAPLDPGALADPFIRGVEGFFELVVFDHAIGQVVPHTLHHSANCHASFLAFLVFVGLRRSGRCVTLGKCRARCNPRFEFFGKSLLRQLER